jgi:hypothetical protein
VNLDVLDRNNASLYWQRDSRHDTVISLSYGHAAAEALGRVIEAWVAHFQAVAVSVRPIRAIEEEHWAWHIGLDAESTAILNELWRGEDVDAGRMRRLLALFQLEFPDRATMRPDIAGRPVYLAIAANDDDVVRVKPQNLLTNLPLAGAIVKPEYWDKAKRALRRADPVMGAIMSRHPRVHMVPRGRCVPDARARDRWSADSRSRQRKAFGTVSSIFAWR